MTPKDTKTKEQYIKDIEKMWDKYFYKGMKSTYGSWESKSSEVVQNKMHELKRELENLTI